MDALAGDEMTRWDFLRRGLEWLEEEELLRIPDDGLARADCESRAEALGLGVLDASSNDYLGYAQCPVSRETTSEFGTGSGASRLIHGTRPVHRELEMELSDWMHREATLLFASGYAANLGLLSSVPQENDLIVSDALNHASIIDGCRLSRADVRVIPHLDADALKEVLHQEAHRRRCWVVTESYFSMDGDTPNLPAMRTLCDTYGAHLIVDEAHALGVFGPEGAGLCRRYGVEPDIMVGTFGKAVGGQGAFVCSDNLVRTWLWNKARSFIYSTATSPILAGYVLKNVRRVRADDLARAQLSRLSTLFRNKLKAEGVPVLAGSHGPIIPIILGGSERAQSAVEHLSHLGILVQAIRPPTVGTGLARIRLTLQASFSPSEIDRLAQGVIVTCAQS